MTNWAPDYTPRVIYHYTSAGVPHTWTFRVPRDTPAGTAASMAFGAADGLVGALASLLPDDFSVTAAFYIAQDTNVTIPITPPPVIGTGAVAVAALSTQDKATSLTFPGKSNLGLRHSISVFGIQLTPDSTTVSGQTYGRILAADAATVANAVAALQSSDLVANDNAGVSWYSYCTNKVNDHWWKEARKTGGL